jgi:hypothetical protein
MSCHRRTLVLALARSLGLAAALLLSVPTSAVLAQGDAAAELVGHWRYTYTGFSTVTDTHLVLHPDGSAETWKVSPEGRSGRETGRWRVDGRQLALTDGNGQFHPQPYTIHEGTLVLPNIQNQRRFWERVR